MIQPRTYDVDDNIILDMVLTTEKLPMTHIICKLVNENLAECTIIDVATKRERAKFRIKEDLIGHIPQLLQLYIK